MAQDAGVSINELRASLVGLTYCCPVDHCNPVDCPLFLLRKLPPADRLFWLDTLAEADLQYIAIYHKVCMRLKLKRHQPPALPPFKRPSQ